MPERSFIDMLRDVGALKSGHFLLSSGRHSDQYVEKFDLLRQPGATSEACARLIRQLGQLAEADLVAGPTTGGILLAFELGRQLSLPAAYAERADSGSMARVFKRGTIIKPGTRVLVVDDILTTGGSLRATLAALEQHGAAIRAVATLVDRSGGNVDFGVPLVSLANLHIDTWNPEECPLCANNVPLEKPGTTDVVAAGQC